MLPRLVCLRIAVLDWRRVRSRSRGARIGISRGADTSAAVTRGLDAAFPVPPSRVGLEILNHGLWVDGDSSFSNKMRKIVMEMDGIDDIDKRRRSRSRKSRTKQNTHGRQVAVRRNIVTLNGLASLWVLMEEIVSKPSQVEHTSFRWLILLPKLAYLIVTRSHQSIIAQIAADISGNYFTIDAITRHKVLVHAGRGSRHC